MSLLLSSSAQRKRLVVLGLDGLPLDLAKKLGVSLPNIGRLAQDATSVRAEIPELSPVNWTSFVTGEGPERHEIYGFSRIDPATYQLSVNDSTHVACPTILDRLGERGLVSRVINLPGTYPARPLRGMLVSGFVSHELAKAAYPPFLGSKLAEADYLLEADTSRGRTDLPYLLKELRQTLASRLTALDMLWPDLGWDMFIHVFTETDRLFHFFYDAVAEQNHPLHLECMRFLVDWDDAIGRFLEKYDALPSPKRLMVMADHGFTGLKTEVCLNTWLRQNGYLSLEDLPADEWDATVISAESKAFALDPGRIYIHSTERFSRGGVSEKRASLIAEELRAHLLDLTYEGERVMEQVWAGNDLYPGNHSEQTPDLVCQARPGFDLKAKFDRDEVFGFHGRTGTHTVDGAFFLDTSGWRPERMRETGNAVLNYFDIPEK